MLGSEIWQKHIEQIADHSIPLAQRNLRQMMEFIEKSGRAKARLMNQLADAIQSSSPAEAQAKFAELWTSGFKAVQSNLGDISELISRTLESWTGFFRKTVEAG
jgi:uncharacterized membrane protein YqiK